jgi:hypothetical protein
MASKFWEKKESEPAALQLELDLESEPTPKPILSKFYF